jgi:hypothetical protein
VEWFTTWVADISCTPPRFQDRITLLQPSSRRLVIGQLQEDIDRLVAIVTRESDSMKQKGRPQKSAGITQEQRKQARLMQLAAAYDPPGGLRGSGRRHDNDFEDISRIRIAPTHNELLCATAPYLPVFLPDAPHHLPVDSIERHLDIQFRLLRE